MEATINKEQVVIIGSTKDGYVTVKITNGEAAKTYERKFYTQKGLGAWVFVDGHKISYDAVLLSVNSVEKVYETSGKVVGSTSGHAKQPVVISKVTEVKKADGEVYHTKFNQIKVCIESNIPVYLAGPAGSGKNHTLEQIAKSLELDFYFTNSVQQEYKLTGFIDAGGKYHETEFYKAFKNGGLFFLDEMDASVPEVLVLLNAAIANGYFEFPTGKVTAHEDFRVVSAGNTVGSGADDQYTGRMVLDQATLDRFVIIHFDYCFKVEMALSKGNKELVDFIRRLRREAESHGIRATFSYRCITQVTKLEAAGLDLNTIIRIAVIKGLDDDTAKTLASSFNKFDKYGAALRDIAC